MRTVLKTNWLAVFILCSWSLKAQHLLQLSDVKDHGISDSSGTGVIFRNSDSTIVYAGNESVNAIQCNFKVSGKDPYSAANWVDYFNAGNRKAYTTSATHDNAGNIYAGGATYVDSIELFNATVIKYDKDGNLQWANNLNGNASSYDIVSDMVVDNTTGDIYITATSFNNAFPPSLDYLTYKLDNSGTLVWKQFYDFSNNMDVPVGIFYESGYVTVSGTSGSSAGNWNFTSIKYKGSSGDTVSTMRLANGVPAQNIETAITKDSGGHLLFTGIVWNGNNKDIKTGKLGNNFNLLWERTFNFHGLNDAGLDIASDSGGNVYVTGYAYNSAAARELVVLKYSANGTLRWQYPKHPGAGNTNAEGLKITVKNDNEIYVGGNQTINGNQNVLLLKFDSLGNNYINKAYDGAGLKDHFFGMAFNDDNIYVAARSELAAGVHHHVTLEYEERDLKPEFSADSTYVKDELMLSFNPAVMKMARVNNKAFEFGKLSDLVADSTCKKISLALSTDKKRVDAGKFKARKIFRDITAADSLSITRLGDTIKAPKFYTTISVSFPDMDYTLLQANDVIKTIKPDVYGSDLDMGFILAAPPMPPAPSDFFWYAQSNLHPTIYFQKAHINVDSAWAITDGLPHVTVGIFDSGFDKYNADFPGIDYDGYDYVANQPAFGADDVDHGTGVAGFIAAAKDNNDLIAGIAGRNYYIGNTGVKMRDFRVMTQWENVTPASRIIQALNRSVRSYTDSAGFGINIMNHSFHSAGEALDAEAVKNDPFQKQLVFATRHGVTIACAKGQASSVGFKKAGFPADWNPEIVSSIGGSGTNGEFCHHLYGQGISPNCPIGAANWGHNIDFVAPASGTTNITLSNGLTGYFNKFLGYTSGATAHVSGAYALMMSYWNYTYPDWHNLTHEDCEHIVSRTCTDLTLTPTYSQTVGWDEVSGWGRINVYQAVKAIDQNYYRLRHLNYNHNGNFSTNGVLLYTAPITWPNYEDVAAGVYNTQVYEVTTQLGYTLAPTEQVIDSWPLYKECYGWADTVGNSIQYDRPYYAKIVSTANNMAVLKTYVYKNLGTGNFYPNAMNNIKSGITLYTYDPNGTGLSVAIKEQEHVNRNFKLQPNPNNGEFGITFGSQSSTHLTYRLFDMLGREVQSGSYQSAFGVNTIPVNIGHLANGIYVLNVADEHKIVYREKVIKN